MGGNQINLFKYRFRDDGTYSNYYDNGDWRWGGYVELLQSRYGAALTRQLTGHNYNNDYLDEVKSVI